MKDNLITKPMLAGTVTDFSKIKDCQYSRVLEEMNDMKDLFKVGLMALLGLVSMIFIAFVFNLGGLEWKKFFDPKYQNVERKVFENTQSYVHGQIKNLSKHYGEYQKGDREVKESIKGIVAVQFAQFPLEQVPSTPLKSFLITCRGY